MAKKSTTMTKSSGNVFIDLGFPPEEVTILAMRADLMGRLRLLIKKKGWTQAHAAQTLGVSQSRVSDLVRGKWDNFSLDMLISFAIRVGMRVQLRMAA